MANTNNLCIFEGRMTSNANYTTFQANGNTIDKASFSISVPRVLSAQDKQALKAGNNSIKTVDFVNLTLTGARVNTLKQYFPAGTPIKVFCTYKTWESVDQTTGQKKYGSNFEVFDIGFVVSPSQNTGNNAPAQNQTPQQNNGYQHNNYQQPAPALQQQAPQNNFEMFSQDEYPF